MDVGDLLAAVDELSRAHTEATCVAAAARVVARHAPLVVLEVRLGLGGASPELHATRSSERTVRWRIEVPLASDLDGALALGFERRSPKFDELACRELAVVVSAALRQARTMARIGDVARRAHATTRDLNEQLRTYLTRDVVAVAPATRRLFGEIVPLVARQDTRVLVLGETGTGKEVVARRIHELSPRARRPFVRINCGAIPQALVESSLFGHERGAFTGAMRRQLGVFERANGGTLLLDEIGELPHDAQAKLLRVLESGEIERVGGERPLRVDVRLIAATHRDLEAMVRRGAFREDLFYRLAVFPITVPPLRERRSEIGPLAQHIADEVARRHGRARVRLDAKARARLRAYDWPGNVRELQNVIERSILLAADDELVIELPTGSSTSSVVKFADASRRAIEAALVASEGRVHGPGGAAALLALKPTTLMSKMKRLGVSRRPSAR